MRIVLLIMALLMSACVAGSATVQKVTIAAQSATPSERAACTRSGGMIERAGRAGFERCTYPYADGGNICRDSRDCDGQCRAKDSQMPNTSHPITGQCQVDDNPFGCYGDVINGRMDAMICVD